MTSGFANPWKKSSNYPVNSSYQSTYGYNAAQNGRATSYGGYNAAQNGRATSYGGSQYGGATAQYQANNLRATTTSYGNAVLQNNLGTNNARVNAVPLSSAGVDTASLVDMHGANVQVVAGQFNDYCMITNLWDRFKL